MPVLPIQLEYYTAPHVVNKSAYKTGGQGHWSFSVIQIREPVRVAQKVDIDSDRHLSLLLNMNVAASQGPRIIIESTDS